MAALTAEPAELRKERLAAEQAGTRPRETSGRMTVDDAEALLARFAASDAAFG